MAKCYFRLVVPIIVGVLLSSYASAADDTSSANRSRLTALLRAVAADGTVIDAVRAQNSHTELQTIYEIYQNDSKWVAETKEEERPTIDALLDQPASALLRQYVEKSGSKELLFVSDQRGTLVASSEVTFRYLMDETGLWKQAFVSRPGSILITPASWHDATADDDGRLWVSVGVRDPKTKDVIGVVSAEFIDDLPVKTISDETSPPLPDGATTETDPPAAHIQH